MERVQLPTADGTVIEADLATTTAAETGPDSDADARTSLILLCHPHPDFGGSRHHLLIDRLLSTLSNSNAGHRRCVMRFDFSGDVSDGALQRDELSAATRYLIGRFGPQPLYLIGYSFGAQIALTSGLTEVTAIAAVACPAPPEQSPNCPALLLVPEHDMFCNPDQARLLTANWNQHRIETVEMTDHFLNGAIDRIVNRLDMWLTDEETRNQEQAR